MAETAEKNKKEKYGVLSKTVGGGPHGLGDPDDKSLRKVEKDICIMQKLRDKTRTEKCYAEWQAFRECCADSGFLIFVLTCRKQNKAIKECSAKWYKDEEFIKECTNQYLEERSEYRRTGMTRRQKEFSTRMRSL